MKTVEKSIEVGVPVGVAYDQWTQFEKFPMFMEGVTSVEQIDDTRLHWRARVGGQEKEWDATITDQRPEQMIAWTSTSGARNAGTVTFEPVSERASRVSLQMDVEPDGVIESVGSAVGILDERVQGDLERFKEFIESRQVPTGAWRGTVDGSKSR